MEQKSNTKRLVVLAFLIALEIILTRFCSIQTPIVRIGFGFLPVAMMGILYGPIWAGIGYAIGDLLGMLIFPSAAYFPGFTLTAFSTGMIFGFFLKGKETHLEERTACQPARDPGMQSVSGYVMALHFDG